MVRVSGGKIKTNLVVMQNGTQAGLGEAAGRMEGTAIHFPLFYLTVVCWSYKMVSD